MAIETRVKWDRQLSLEELDSIHAKIQTYVDAGVTDGNLIFTNTWEMNPESYRIFTSEEAANEWVAFLNSLTPPPTKAVVQNT